MDSSKKIDAVDKIKHFQERILANKPEIGEMVYDVQMMNFKIRPISGDILSLIMETMILSRHFGVWENLMSFFEWSLSLLSRMKKMHFFG